MDHHNSEDRRYRNEGTGGSMDGGSAERNVNGTSSTPSDLSFVKLLNRAAQHTQPVAIADEGITGCSAGFAFLFRHSAQPSLLVDRDGLVVDFNLAATQLFSGFSELKGTPLLNHLQGFPLSDFSGFLAEVSQSENQMFDTAILNGQMEYQPVRLDLKESDGLFLVCVNPVANDLSRLNQSDPYEDQMPVASVKPFFVFDTHGGIVHVNQKALHFTGYSYDEISSLSAKELFYDTGFLFLKPDAGYRVDADYYTMLRVIRGGLPVDVPVAMRQYGQLSFVVTLNDDDSLLPKGSQWRKSNDYFHLLVDNFTDLIVVTDAEGRYLYANGKYCELFGKDCHELMLTSIEPAIYAEDLLVATIAMHDLLKSPYTCAYEARMMTIRGWRWISWNGQAVLNQAGRVTELIRSGRDITYQKEIGDALMVSELKYRRLHESLMDGFARTDLDGNILEVNHVMADILGYSKKEMLGLNFRVITPVRWHSLEEEVYMKQVVNRGHTDVYEKEYIHKSGNIIPAEIRAFLIRSSDGKPEGVWALIRDISQRKLVEQNLLLFKAIVEASSEAVAVSKPDGSLVYINPAHEQLFGRPLAEARTLNFRDYYPPESVKILNEIVVPKHNKGESWEGILDVFDVTGRRFPLWERSGTLFDVFGAPEYYFGIMHDVSVQQLAEQARLENLRLETEELERTRLSRELHDHIGHLMTAVKLMLENLSLKLTKADHKNELNEILELVQFLFKELRAITSRLTVKQPESKNLRETIDSIVDDFNKLKRMAVVSHFEFLPTKVPVEVRNNLIRILEEALTNALKHSGASRVDLRFWKRGKWLVISVKDNGRGLTEGVFSGGSGLRFMKQRAESVGGTFKIGSSPSGSCELVVEIPLGSDSG